jgi:hypothetical protein
MRGVESGGAGDSLALYPMVEISAATGTVAAVYAQIAEVMPIVPSVFKSLAVCPPYLALAWDQAAPILRTETYHALAGELADLVQAATIPPEDPHLRDALAAFVPPLSQMLLLCAGLREALAGRLEGVPARVDVPLVEGPIQPHRPVPTPEETGDEKVYLEIMAALRTPLINSIWRSLAGQGLLRPTWNVLCTQVDQTREDVDGLTERVSRSAYELAWPVVASPTALKMAGIANAGPGMSTILDCYLATLPRVLTLVASSAL